MPQIFKAKLRQFGTSAGIILPKERLADAHAAIGEEVELVLLPHKRDFSALGIAKGFKSFRRDKKIRTFMQA